MNDAEDVNVTMADAYGRASARRFLEKLRVLTNEFDLTEDVLRQSHMQAIGTLYRAVRDRKAALLLHELRTER